jgi:hypothetical protein
MKVTYPAGSHNAVNLTDSAITQICDVRLLTGEADVMMRFDQDEWNALSGGTLVNITFGAVPGEEGEEGQDPLSIYQKMANPELRPSNEIYFDEVAQMMENTKHKREDLVDWVALAFNDMLDNAFNIPPNPYIP